MYDRQLFCSAHPTNGVLSVVTFSQTACRSFFLTTKLFSLPSSFPSLSLGSKSANSRVSLLSGAKKSRIEMLLSDLPDEVLASILACHSASTSVVALWTCGSQHLNTRLSRRGCDSFVFSDTWAVLPKLPAVLDELKSLRILHIRAACLGIMLSDSLPSIQRLSSLVELRLEIAMGDWYLIDRTSSETVSLLELVKRADTQGVYSLTWDIKSFLPVLETLVCKDIDRATKYPPIGPQSFSHLPSTLKTLEWKGSFVVPQILQPDSLPSEEPFALLPRGLTVLRLGSIPSSLDYSSLPSSLTFVSGFKENTTAEQMATLPRGLTDVSKMTIPSWTPFLSSHIPTSVTKLPIFLDIDYASFESNTIPWHASLPPLLTKLSLYEHAFRPSEIATLPPSLTSIKRLRLHMESLEPLLTDVDWSPFLQENLLPWPPALRHVSLGPFSRGTAARCPELTISLPRSLTSLENMYYHRGDHWLLPPGLINLTVTHLVPNLDNMDTDDKDIDPLPHTLRSYLTTDCQFLYSFEVFPQGLRTLSLLRRALSPEMIAAIPRGVTTLTLQEMSSGSFDALPQGLQSLSLAKLDVRPRANTLLSRLTAADYDDDDDDEDYRVEESPDPSSHFYSDFNLLPPSLRKLRLEDILLHAEVLRHLPRSIETLEATITLPREMASSFWPSLPPHCFALLRKVDGHPTLFDLAKQYAPDGVIVQR